MVTGNWILHLQREPAVGVLLGKQQGALNLGVAPHSLRNTQKNKLKLQWQLVSRMWLENPVSCVLGVM